MIVFISKLAASLLNCPLYELEGSHPLQKQLFSLLYIEILHIALEKDHFVIQADDVEAILQIIQGPRCPLATELLWLY